MMYDVEKRYLLKKDDTEVFFETKREAEDYLENDITFRSYALESVDCLACNLMKDKIDHPYGSIFLVNIVVDDKLEELWVEGTYGEVFVVVHEYMNGRNYKIISVYDYIYYYGSDEVVYEEKIPSEFVLSLLDYVNVNNAGMISALIEDVNVNSMEELLNEEELKNMSGGKYFYDYNVVDGKVVLTADGIKKRCRSLSSYFATESFDMNFLFMQDVFKMQAVLRQSDDIDELLYVSGKLHYYLRYQIAYPYTYYKMVVEGKFSDLRLLKDTFV